MRYFFEISYKGTNFHGWQIQNNAISIQEIIQDRISQLIRVPTEITGSGRTDAGVHALHQVFHADFIDKIDRIDFKYHLNQVLPDDIFINQILEVKHDAHARFDATSRSYNYIIADSKNPFKTGLNYLYNRPINLELLNEASKLLVGKHDFESFSKVKTQVHNFVCEIFEASWSSKEHEIIFFVKANRFLRGMVRAMVGTLLMVNENKIEAADLRDIINAKNRSKAGRSVPPEGLYMSEISYPDHIYENKS